MEKILVTGALPYANGRLHIGHVAGAYLPADIYVRFLRLTGKEVLFICGTDEHGAPISIKAESEGVQPRDIVDRYHKSIQDSFNGLNIIFNNFSGTARQNHHKLSQEFFLNLLEAGYINVHTNAQMYCEHDKRFLPDRYVEGICPDCGAKGARGDQCDTCGKLVDSVKLIEPKCKICNNTPVVKDTTHWFLNLPKFETKLRDWIETKTNWKDNVHRFIMSWLEEGLIERAITRDIDWGVPVPLENAEGKVLYVWFDAPIGYISSTIEWAEKTGQPDKWKEYWLNPETKMYHFIGKDNIPFHTIIWPALLMGQKEKYILPEDVPANEYLNLEGDKISTSKDYAIWVDDYLKLFDGEWLRYVLACNAPENKDSDFTWKDFQGRVNNELANILGNLANRVFAFTKKSFTNQIPIVPNLSECSQTVLKEVQEKTDEIKESYQNFRVRKAVKIIMDIARLGNKYFDETKPWVEIKAETEKAAETIYICAEILRKVSVLLSPIMPDTMNVLRKMMNLPEVTGWDELNLSYSYIEELGDFQPLFKKIEDSLIEEQVNLLKAKTIVVPAVEYVEKKKEIEYEDFAKLDLRIGTIIQAVKVEKSKKLLQLQVDLGFETRQVIAGIGEFYKAEEAIGKKVVLLINLKPRKIMGLESQGMILAADFNGTMTVLKPDKDIPIGALIS